MAEYVSRRECRSYREAFEKVLASVRNNMRKEGVTFTCNLVGSGKRNLIVRHPQKGFDLDYQIVIQTNKKNFNARTLNEKFRLCFDRAKGAGFSHSEDSTSALTIKLKDTNRSRVKFAYDVVLLRKSENGTEIIRRNTQGEYVWNTLKDMDDFHNRLEYIWKNAGMRERLKEIYWQKKIDQMEGRTSKKSYQLLHEAINEVLKQPSHPYGLRNDIEEAFSHFKQYR